MTEHHKARRLALQGLCCLDVQGGGAMDMVEVFIQDSRESLQTAVEARAMLQQAFAARDRIDSVLEGESRHWNISRMALVDRNILRLAVWELLESKAPKKVVITEALRLAKEFATAESSRFINGVLDATARKISRDEEDKKDASERIEKATEAISRDGKDEKDRREQTEEAATEEATEEARQDGMDETASGPGEEPERQGVDDRPE